MRTFATFHKTTALMFTKARERDKIIEWLRTSDPLQNHKNAMSICQSNTGRWFTSSCSFANWLRTHGSLLLLQGALGYGKTVLTSTIIEYLRSRFLGQQDVAILFYYFDFNDKDKQKLDGLTRSLLIQLLRQCRLLSKKVKVLYDQSQKLQQPRSPGQCEEALLELVDGFNQVFIVIDALNECKEQRNVAQLLRQLRTRSAQHTHVLVTSQEDSKLKKHLQVSAAEIEVMQSDHVDTDIQLYVDEQLRTDDNLSMLPDDTKSSIRDTLTSKAKGTFRWVACQIEELRECVSPAQICQTLESLPATLHETYSKILMRIPRNHQRSVSRILQLVAFSMRPMRIDEVVESLAVDPENNLQFHVQQRFFETKEILNYCRNLIMIQPYLDVEESTSRDPRLKGTYIEVVKLAHSSVQEYLVSDRVLKTECSVFGIREDTANISIARTCLTYLMELRHCKNSIDEVLKAYPLMRYAADYWHGHAACAELDLIPPETLKVDYRLSILTLEVVRFLDNKNAREAWEEMTDNEIGRLEEVSPLYHASFYGLRGVVEEYLKRGADVNRHEGFWRTALRAASWENCFLILPMLLAAGALVNDQDECTGGTALHAASIQGHTYVARFLLKKGASLTITGYDVWEENTGTPLHAALAEGRPETVELLLEQGADVDAACYGSECYADNPLHAAVCRGDDDMVRLLLRYKAKVNLHDEYTGGTPLHAASYNGDLTLVRLLLEHGAEVDAQGHGLDLENGGTPLQAASSMGHVDVMRLLLKSGANPNICNRHPRLTALCAAVSDGHEAAVRLLLAWKAEVDVPIPRINITVKLFHVDQEQAVALLSSVTNGSKIKVSTPGNGTVSCVVLFQERKTLAEICSSFRQWAQDEQFEHYFSGGTYVNTAKALGHNSIVKILEEHGAHASIQSTVHNCLRIHVLLHQGSTELIQFLTQ